MVAGGLDASFFIVYVGQGPLTPEGYDNAYKQAVTKFDAVHLLTEKIAPDKIELALTAADVRRISKAGKKVALIGVENGYPLGDASTAVKRVKEFYDRGARYLSLAHNGHSQLADSNNGEASGEWAHNGLSELGKQVIAELNRVGIMVDLSHPSKPANMQAIALSKAPVIASHSSARALCDHSRNMDDELLLALKKNGGVVQTVAFATYVKTPPPPTAERLAALTKLEEEFGLPAGSLGRGGRGGGRGRGAAPGGAAPPAAAAGAPSGAGQGRGRGRGGALAQLPDDKRAEAEKRLAEIDKQFPPPPRANVKDFADHIDYIVKKIGIDHVGISSDFDGGGGIDGWNDASETFNVTLELVRRGYTEEQIGKIWSGNLLRVMEEVRQVAVRMQK
jgi:membrane dipeptidase